MEPHQTQDALAERLAVSSIWANRIAYSVVLVGVAFGAALLASPGLYSQKIPELKADDVGKPFRAAGARGVQGEPRLRGARRGEDRGGARGGAGPRPPGVRLRPFGAVGGRAAMEEAFAAMQEVVDEFKLGTPQRARASPTKTRPRGEKKPDPEEKEGRRRAD